MKAEVLGVGASFLDHIVHVTDPFLASLGGVKGGMESLDKKAFESLLQKVSPLQGTRAGGSSANVLKGLSALDHTCALWGVIGTDGGSITFKNSLAKQNVHALLQEVPAPMGQVLCLVTPDGERTFRDFLGASVHMKDLQPTLKLFEGVRLVQVEGYNLLYGDFAERVMQTAHAAGVQISFDLASVNIAEKYSQEIFRLLEKYVSILFSNALEAKALTQKSPQESCAFLQKFCPTVVVTEGIAGCWIGSKNGVQHCKAFPVTPLDTTGAGDLFAAGFLHGILQGEELPLCAQYGALLAAEVVQVLGAELPLTSIEKIKPLLL